MSSRRRRSRAWRVVWAAVVMLLTLSAGTATVCRQPAPPAALRHVVQRGDTLWHLASLADAPRVDRRELVWLLQTVNGLSGATLYPGQALLIPAGPAAVRAARRDPAGFATTATVTDDLSAGSPEGIR